MDAYYRDVKSLWQCKFYPCWRKPYIQRHRPCCRASLQAQRKSEAHGPAESGVCINDSQSPWPPRCNERRDLGCCRPLFLASYVCLYISSLSLPCSILLPCLWRWVPIDVIVPLSHSRPHLAQPHISPSRFLSMAEDTTLLGILHSPLVNMRLFLVVFVGT